MQFTLLLSFAATVLAGCSDGGRGAPPAVATYVCQTNSKSPTTLDVKTNYIPYFQTRTGQQCGTSGGCCTSMYHNAKMCGAAGSEDCGQVAIAIKTIVDECSAYINGVERSGGGYWSGALNSGTWVSL